MPSSDQDALSTALVFKALPFRFHSGVLYFKLYIHFSSLEFPHHKLSKRDLRALLATLIIGAAIKHAVSPIGIGPAVNTKLRP